MWWSTKIEWWVLSSDCKLLTKENIPFQAVKNAYLVWTWMKKKGGGMEKKKSFASSMQTLHIHYDAELGKRVWKQELHFGALWTMERRQNWQCDKTGSRFLFLDYITGKDANVERSLLASPLKALRETHRTGQDVRRGQLHENLEGQYFNSSVWGKYQYSTKHLSPCLK